MSSSQHSSLEKISRLETSENGPRSAPHSRVSSNRSRSAENRKGTDVAASAELGPATTEGPLKILSVPISFLSFWVRWDPCFAALYEHKLYVYGDITDKQENNHFLSLDFSQQNVLVAENPKGSGVHSAENSFTVYTVSNGAETVFAQFQASSRQEMERWIQAMTSMVENKLDLSGNGKEDAAAFEQLTRKLQLPHVVRSFSLLTSITVPDSPEEIDELEEEEEGEDGDEADESDGAVMIGMINSNTTNLQSSTPTPFTQTVDGNVSVLEGRTEGDTVESSLDSFHEASPNDGPSDAAGTSATSEKRISLKIPSENPHHNDVNENADPSNVGSQNGVKRTSDKPIMSTAARKQKRKKNKKNKKKAKEALSRGLKGQNEAATRIQRLWKTRKARRQFLLRRRQTILIQAYVRRYLAKRALNSIRRECTVLKYQPKRTRVLMELYATEMSYVSDLDTAIKVFLKPLRALFDAPSVKKGNVGKDQIVSIFGNIEDIAERHRAFTEELGKLVEVWSENERLAPLILKMSKWLFVYVPYCNNYEMSHGTLAKCKKVPAFQSFLDTAGGVKLCKRLDLSSFLILPVQRIPRYELLLKELIKITWLDHPDLPDLKIALQRIHDSAKLVNRAKQYNDSKEKIASLTNKLRMQHPAAADHRRYLGEGPILYISPNTDRPVAAYLFLFNDQMLVTKRHYERKKLKSHTVKFSCLCNIAIGGVALASVTIGGSLDSQPDSAGGSNPGSGGWLGSPTKESKESLQIFRYSFTLHVTGAATGTTLDHRFFTDTQETRDKWISDLEEALQDKSSNPSVADISELLALGDDDLPETSPLSNGSASEEDFRDGTEGDDLESPIDTSPVRTPGVKGLTKDSRWNSWDSVTLLGGKVRRQKSLPSSRPGLRPRSGRREDEGAPNASSPGVEMKEGKKQSKQNSAGI